MIVCSLNEVEAYARRAARGAGMHWGLAEEAGKATRWLAERDLPGVPLLAELLTANRERAYEDMAPVIVDGRWRAAKGELCPLCSGAALWDRSDLLTVGEEIHLLALGRPLLLTPFLDQTRRSRGACWELRWTGVRIAVSAGGVAVECSEESALLTGRADEVTVLVGADSSAGPTHRPRTAGVSIPIAAWRTLEALAKRTYVPASEESRARGAGAGSTDND